MFRLGHALIVFVASAILAGNAFAQSVSPVGDESLYAAPREGGARRWQVARADSAMLRESPGGPALRGPLPVQTVLTNYGCEAHAGTVWCRVRPLDDGHRGFVAAADLSPVPGPDGTIARGVDDSAARAKHKRFDLTAEVLCAQERGQTLAACAFGVAREDGGDATAAVTFPSGFTRFLFFVHGTFVSASPTMSGAGRDTDWRVEDGIHYIRADDQRFEIPHVLLFGADYEPERPPPSK